MDLARLTKAFDQWLDGADDRVTRAAFVCGEPRSGAHDVVAALGAAPQGWPLLADGLAHEGGRLRSPRAVAALTKVLPADVVVLEAVDDSHVLDRLLALHEGSRALWLYRPWRDVAALGAADPDPADAALVGALVRDEPVTPPLPEGLRERLRAALPSAPGPAYAAVAAWCVRAARLLAHGLQADPRVRRVDVARLGADPDATLAEAAAFLGLAAPPPITPSLPTPGKAPELTPGMIALADALERRLTATS